MIFERWDAQFDMVKLAKHLREVVLPIEPVLQSAAFGGWSVLSSDGTIEDGWHKGHLLLNRKNATDYALAEIEQGRLKPSTAYNIPTSICQGYLAEVIDNILRAGIQPCRARIIQLAAGQSSLWHKDAPEDIYSVRLHIPIITNSGCFFETETERAHLPADGSAYFIKVNRMHRVINLGTENRYHLVMNIFDEIGFSKFHQRIEMQA